MLRELANPAGHIIGLQLRRVESDYVVEFISIPNLISKRLEKCI
jgi:hypothetical protein